ncbi:MAG: RIP metalloprotease RseP [Clostridia bacterium]|nr:RIP metalloprotease RseP [Clostridia bacterium]
MGTQVLLVALVLFSLLIVFHELGHFLVAKLAGIKVREFSIGMGPLVFGRRVGETFYALRLVPLGGYNRMAGMEPEDLDDPRGFNRKGLGTRFAVIAAGSLMNLALAVLLYALIFAAVGLPSNSAVIGKVVPGRPAARAGLAAGDRIVAVDGQPVADWSELVGKIRQHPGEQLRLTVERGKERFTVAVVPETEPGTQTGLIGIEQSVRRLNPPAAVWQAVRQTGLMLALIIASLGQMITGRVPVDLVGPVGIVQLLGQAARFGAASVLGFAAFISLNLGLLNLFPVPALDGSRLLFLAVEGLRGKPVDPRKESLIHLVGFAVLLMAILIITYRDLVRLFG